MRRGCSANGKKFASPNNFSLLQDVSTGPDLKMHQALAQQIGEEASGGKLDLKGLLEKVPVKIGGGKTKVSLYEAIPSMGFGDLERIVEDFQRG